MAIIRDFKIEQLLELVARGKYEVTDAGFAAIDRLEKIPIAKKMQRRKVAVQVMDAIQRDEVHYYFKPEAVLDAADLEKAALAGLKAIPVAVAPVAPASRARPTFSAESDFDVDGDYGDEDEDEKGDDEEEDE